MPAATSATVHQEAIVELRRHRRAGAVPSEENFIWMGRHLAYLGEYESAIDEYSVGLEHYHGSCRLLRHRGHRWITLRRFDRAVEDLSRSASLIEIESVPDEIEPDGLQNKACIPRSTTHGNIYYHLGLAQYLRGEFEEALRAYEKCMAVVRNDDMHVATAYWMYLTQKHLGLDEDARRTLEPIRQSMEVLENTTYRDLLLLYRSTDDLMAGRRGAMWMAGNSIVAQAQQDATAGYGVGMMHLLHGRVETAVEVFRDVIESANTSAFGYIAAEVELARLSKERE